MVNAQPPRSYSSSEIYLNIQKLGTTGSVLYIAAHPDDENTRLLAFLANDLGVETNYLSLTRGDGGQNLIGTEKGIDLGIIRTQELLAARRTDGAKQFFTRAYDFGFSKNPEETLSKWNHEQVLSDVVWVIRTVQPDVIITRFATDGSGGHGHHTSSAILAEEAFDAAADPNRFPEQLTKVSTWQAKRLFWNVSTRFQNPNADMSAYIPLDVGGYNALLGKSYGEIAAESRSMHKSQGFGSARQRGEALEYFKPIKGDTSNLKSIFQGMRFDWSLIKDGTAIQQQFQNILSDYNFKNPVNILPELLHLKSLWEDRNENILQQKKQQLDEIIMACAGLVFDITSPEPQIAIGDSLPFDIRMINRSSAMITVHGISYSGNALHFKNATNLNKTLLPNIQSTMSETCIIKDVNELKQWLANDLNNDLFSPENMDKRELPQKKAPLSLEIDFSINNTPFTLSKPIQYRWTDPEKGELYRPIVVTPTVMVNPVNNVIIFGDNTPKEIKIAVRAGKENVKGNITLLVEKGWSIQPQNQPFSIAEKNGEQFVSFMVTAPKTNTESKILPVATVNGKPYSRGIYEIHYDHIPIQTSFREADIKAIKLDLIKKSKRIGYIEGAGDDVAKCLEQIGYSVTSIAVANLANENLTRYDAIVVGVRAYNIHEDLFLHNHKLQDYMKNGGNLIVQYNTNSWAGPLKGDLGPYPFEVVRDRVTDETAEVHFELPNHPVLNTPNKITSKDFHNWIQERCIYTVANADSRYQLPLSMADPNEPPVKGSLAIAQYGKGNYIYTGLVFFRELPAGVPGAYRLFTNLIELGK